jgi:hypothetical protein
MLEVARLDVSEHTDGDQDNQEEGGKGRHLGRGAGRTRP